MVSWRDLEPKNSKKPLALDDIEVLQLHCTYIRIKIVYNEARHNNSINCFGGLTGKSPLLHIEMYHKNPSQRRYWKFKLIILTGKLNHLLNAPSCGWMELLLHASLASMIQRDTQTLYWRNQRAKRNAMLSENVCHL